jgi:hypothetical protein
VLSKIVEQAGTRTYSFLSFCRTTLKRLEQQSREDRMIIPAAILDRFGGPTGRDSQPRSSLEHVAPVRWDTVALRHEAGKARIEDVENVTARDVIRPDGELMHCDQVGKAARARPYWDKVAMLLEVGERLSVPVTGEENKN